MTSIAVRRARIDGYQFTGITTRYVSEDQRLAVIEEAKKLKVMGNKVKIIVDRDVTEFRDRKDTHTYYAVYVKYSEEYLAFKREENKRHDIERRKSALRSIADTCTLDEIHFMLNFKIESIMKEKDLAIQELEEKCNEPSIDRI